MATFAIALAAALLFGAGIGVLGMCGYLATSRIERAVVERRTAEVTGARVPGLWGRLWGAVLRRVVRRLRRHRYAAVAGRIRALEDELAVAGAYDAMDQADACQAAMVLIRADFDPDDAMEVTGLSPVFGGVVAYWTEPPPDPRLTTRNSE